MSRLSVSVAPCPRMFWSGCLVEGVQGRGSSMEALEGVAWLLSSVPSLPSPSEHDCLSVGSCSRWPSANSYGEGRKIFFWPRLLSVLLSPRDCRRQVLSLANYGPSYSFSLISFTGYSSFKLYSTTPNSYRRFSDDAGSVFSARMAQIYALMAVGHYEIGCYLFRMSWETRQAPIDLQLIEQFAKSEYFRRQIRKRPYQHLRTVWMGFRLQGFSGQFRETLLGAIVYL